MRGAFLHRLLHEPLEDTRAGGQVLVAAFINIAAVLIACLAIMAGW